MQSEGNDYDYGKIFSRFLLRFVLCLCVLSLFTRQRNIFFSGIKLFAFIFTGESARHACRFAAEVATRNRPSGPLASRKSTSFESSHWRRIVNEPIIQIRLCSQGFMRSLTTKAFALVFWCTRSSLWRQRFASWSKIWFSLMWKIPDEAFSSKKPSDLVIKFGSGQSNEVKEIITHPNFFKSIETLQDNIVS